MANRHMFIGVSPDNRLTVVPVGRDDASTPDKYRKWLDAEELSEHSSVLLDEDQSFQLLTRLKDQVSVPAMERALRR